MSTPSTDREQRRLTKFSIEFEEYLMRIGLTKTEYLKLIGVTRPDDVQTVIPLTGLRNITSILPLKARLLLTLVRRIPTIYGRLPFVNAEIRLIKIDPEELRVCQKFVYRDKYQELIETLPRLFKDFALNGNNINSLGACVVLGEDENGTICQAFYLPPIIERHGHELIILDGVHRAYIYRSLGLPINCLVVENITLPFPCDTKNWDSITIIDSSQRPPNKPDRLWNTQPELFRNLHHLGIDG